MRSLAIAVLALALGSSARAEDLSGTVTETMDSGGYTYLLIKTRAGDKRWAAVTQAPVKKGQAVTVVGAMDMKDFESRTLKRKFERIAFGNLNAPQAAGAADPHGGRVDIKGPIAVAKAPGEDGRTVAELYAQKSALKGRTVALAGKVVKFNPDILGANWAHLRDGTGSAKDGSDDVTVVMKDRAEIGQVITVRGKVVLDKDLGGMYKFPVALEDAVLVK